MTRLYEVVYIFDSALEETAINEKLERFHQLTSLGDGKAPELNHWGKRTLAYPIRNHETGYYVIAKFETSGDKLPEFERAAKLDEGLLRFLVVLSEGEQTAPVGGKSGDEEDEE